MEKQDIKNRIENAKSPQEMAQLVKELLGDSHQESLPSITKDTTKMKTLLSNISKLGQESIDTIFAKDNTAEFKKEVDEATKLNIPGIEDIPTNIPKPKTKEKQDLSKEEILNASLKDLLK